MANIPTLPPPIHEQREHIDARETPRKLDSRFATAVEREQQSRSRLRAQVRERERGADMERAKAVANGGSLLVGASAEAELSAALEEQRLLQALIFAANEELAAVVSRLTFEAIEGNADWIRGQQKRIQDAREMMQQEVEKLHNFFVSLRERGYVFFDADVLRRLAP